MEPKKRIDTQSSAVKKKPIQKKEIDQTKLDEAIKEVEVQRRIRGQEKVFHDLFRLNAANTRKNINWEPLVINADGTSNAIWENITHKHFYHTYDSSGKKHTKCAPIAGHFHEIELSVNEEGEFEAVCGPPMVMSKGRVTPYANDKHTHEIEYLGSEEIEVRKKNSEATKVINAKLKQERERLVNPLA